MLTLLGTRRTQVASLGNRRDVLAPNRITRRTGVLWGWDDRNQGQEPRPEAPSHSSPLCSLSTVLPKCRVPVHQMPALPPGRDCSLAQTEKVSIQGDAECKGGLCTSLCTTRELSSFSLKAKAGLPNNGGHRW